MRKLIYILLVISLSSCGSIIYLPYGSIGMKKGKVEKAKNRRNIRRASVEFYQGEKLVYQDYTNWRGRYKSRFEELGTLNMVVRKEGFVTYMDTCSLSANQPFICRDVLLSKKRGVKLAPVVAK